MRSRSYKQAGDTIIEVVLAVAIFSMVAVGAITIMNNGIAMAQRSLEITLVRQQVDSQAEMLRYISDRSFEDPVYQARWRSITDRAVASPTEILDSQECPGREAISGRFALIPDGAGGIGISEAYQAEPTTYARVNTESSPGVTIGSEGLSVQMVKSGSNAYDAYIQACWYGPGSSVPATIGTIVRLYDPSA